MCGVNPHPPNLFKNKSFKKGDNVKKEQLERANKIQERLKELNILKEWIHTRKNVDIIASGCSISDIIPLSKDMKNVMYGMCVSEIAKLEKNFEEL